MSAASETLAELWDVLTDAEREDCTRHGDAFSSRMVAAAPEDAQLAFADLVCREWARDL